MANEKQHLGWHFLRSNRKLGYEDGRVVKAGEPLTVDVEPELCKRGLHASQLLKAALWYAPGMICCRVILSGDVVTRDDKMAGRSRTVLWMVDAEKILKRWALDCAKSVQHLSDDPRVVHCIELTEKYLDGDEGVSREALKKARSDAWAANYAAHAYSAASAAARAAACAADAVVNAADDAEAAAFSAAAYAVYAAAANAANAAAYVEEKRKGYYIDLENRIIQAATDEGVWVEDPA